MQFISLYDSTSVCQSIQKEEKFQPQFAARQEVLLYTGLLPAERVEPSRQ